MAIEQMNLSSLNSELTEDSSAWDSYVEACSEASNYHRWIWRQVIEETFGHKPYYIMAKADHAVVGVLPLFEIQSRLFGHFMVSMPFFTYGGVLASTAEAQRSLLAKAEELARELGVSYVELRQGKECALDWPVEADKVVLGLALPASAEALYQSFSSKLRNRIRHCQKQGFELRVGGLEEVNTFYDIFAVNMRHLGSPVYPRAWFENICRYEPERARILTAWKAGKAAAAVFVIGFRERLEVPWSASLPESRKDYSAMWLEWTMFSWAAENGYRWMDLGRSTPGSASYMFKHQWTNHESPLYWYRWLAPATSAPRVRKEDERFRLAIGLWRRLPLNLTKRLGPLIVRGIP